VGGEGDQKRFEVGGGERGGDPEKKRTRSTGKNQQIDNRIGTEEKKLLEGTARKKKKL